MQAAPGMMMGGTTTGAGGMGQILELFKIQFLMKMMNSSDVAGGRGSQWNSLLTMLVLFFYDQFAKFAPQYIPILFAWVFGSWTKPKEDLKTLPLMPSAQPPPTSKSIRACIQFERTPETKGVDPRIEAVMHHVCNLPDVRSLRYNGVEMIPNFKDMIMIDNDIWFEILNVQSNPTFSINATSGSSVSTGIKQEPILYRLSTYDHDITWLHKFVEQAMDRFEQEKKNKLGSESYYFDHIASVGGPYRNPLSKSFCTFSKSKFQSNRSLRNVYLRQIGELQERVEFFLRRRDWYDSKGISHTLGVVMYGHPGCGKTSTIKAIANETKRHIFNISLGAIKTKEALKDLFYNDNVNILADGKMEMLNIPIKQRVYVIEDIDAMDSVVVKRSALNEKEDEERKLKIEAEVKWLEQTQGKDMAKRMMEGKETENQDQLDLATLLNVLDGVRETPGRIIILSTNYPERLDEALLRPGRFDMMLEFEKHSCTVLKQHLEAHYDKKLNATQVAKLANPLLNYKWTPAEVSQVLFRRVADMDAAIEDLVKEDPKKMFKFSQMKGTEDKDSQGTDLSSLIDIMPLPQEEELKKKSNPPSPKNQVVKNAPIIEPIPQMVLEEGFKMVYDEIQQVQYALDKGVHTDEERAKFSAYLKELQHMNTIYTRYITGFKTEALHRTLTQWMETFSTKRAQMAVPRQVFPTPKEEIFIPEMGRNLLDKINKNLADSGSTLKLEPSKELLQDPTEVALSDLKRANPIAVVERHPLTELQLGNDIAKDPSVIKQIHIDFRREKERISEELVKTDMDETRRNALNRYKDYLREFEQSLIAFDVGDKAPEDVETFKENIRTFYDAKQMNSHPSQWASEPSYTNALEKHNYNQPTKSLTEEELKLVEAVKKTKAASEILLKKPDTLKVFDADDTNDDFSKLFNVPKEQKEFDPDDYPMSGGTSLSRDDPSPEQMEAIRRAQEVLGKHMIGMPHDAPLKVQRKYETNLSSLMDGINKIGNTNGIGQIDTVVEAVQQSVFQDPEAKLIAETLLSKGFDGEFFSGFVQGFDGNGAATSLEDFFKIST